MDLSLVGLSAALMTQQGKVAVVDESFAKRYFNRVDIVGRTEPALGRYNIKVKVVGVLGMKMTFSPKWPESNACDSLYADKNHSIHYRK